MGGAFSSSVLIPQQWQSSAEFVQLAGREPAGKLSRTWPKLAKTSQQEPIQRAREYEGGMGHKYWYGSPWRGVGVDGLIKFNYADDYWADELTH